jgi:SAM-dependent methyltransferase
MMFDARWVRSQVLAICNEEEAARVDGWTLSLDDDDHAATWEDLRPHWEPRSSDAILDAGAGTGALCLTLVRRPHRSLTALDPAPAMLDRLGRKPELASVQRVQGFCDHPEDAAQFADGSFDVIASRQLTNGLFDPIAAFRNWNQWLGEGGTVVVVDGFYDRDAWTGAWEALIDQLPLSACRTMATVPYLLARCGFRIEHVGLMQATNARPSTRTRRYLVVARKVADWRAAG